LPGFCIPLYPDPFQILGDLPAPVPDTCGIPRKLLIGSIEANQTASTQHTIYLSNLEETTMNTKAIYVACLFAALNICTLSARAEAHVTPVSYSYGTHLDIKKVVSQKQDASPSCGVVNAQLTYLDSQSKTQVLDYRKLADNCNSDN
jgi:hypothetical protein